MNLKLFYAIALFALFLTSCTKDQISVEDPPLDSQPEQKLSEIEAFEQEQEGLTLQHPGDYLDESNNELTIDGYTFKAGQYHKVEEMPRRLQTYFKSFHKNGRSVGDKHMLTSCTDVGGGTDLGQELRGWKSGVGHTYLDAAPSYDPYRALHYELDPKGLQNFTQYYGGTPYKYHNYQWINYNGACLFSAMAWIEVEDYGIWIFDMDQWTINPTIERVNFRSYAENDVGWIIVPGDVELSDEAAVRFSNFVYSY